MQHLLVEYQFCQEKKVLGIDILISVFVKGAKNWVDLKTNLPLQQQKWPLQGGEALRGEGRGWEAHGICSETRHPCQWACYCGILKKSEFLLGLFLILLLYFAENLFFQPLLCKWNISSEIFPDWSSQRGWAGSCSTAWHRERGAVTGEKAANHGLMPGYVLEESSELVGRGVCGQLHGVGRRSGVPVRGVSSPLELGLGWWWWPRLVCVT